MPEILRNEEVGDPSVIAMRLLLCAALTATMSCNSSNNDAETTGTPISEPKNLQKEMQTDSEPQEPAQKVTRHPNTRFGDPDCDAMEKKHKGNPKANVMRWRDANGNEGCGVAKAIEHPRGSGKWVFPTAASRR